MFRCICGKAFSKVKSMSAHTATCKTHFFNKYGNYEKFDEIYVRRNESIRKTWKKKKEERRNDIRIKKTNSLICEKCKVIFESENSKKRFCSRRCANSRPHSTERKKRISETWTMKKSTSKKLEQILCYCRICGKDFQCKRHNKFCSKECLGLFNRIPTYIKYFHFDKSAIGSLDVFAEVEKVKNRLYNLYWENEYTTSEICSVFNYPNSSNLIAKVFKPLGIPSRTLSESISLSHYKSSPKPSKYNYKCGWHITWDNKKVYYRSSNELRYAIQLDNEKIEYDTESVRIRYFDTLLNKTRTAVADFYIPSKNLIVEIKSSYTFNRQNMLDRAKVYLDLGYGFKMILDGVEYLYEDIKKMKIKDK